ncbi:unnamed protein product [Pleuronectes platessa]|uniref:Uncharacterized protein n=1 Tax=Pleuronectes platessa TaxID=8262 RepID=A0A9N7V752_PLEPL|nr:unnamed protein product [Pleuronectes platessa]
MLMAESCSCPYQGHLENTFNTVLLPPSKPHMFKAIIPVTADLWSRLTEGSERRVIGEEMRQKSGRPGQAMESRGPRDWETGENRTRLEGGGDKGRVPNKTWLQARIVPKWRGTPSKGSQSFGFQPRLWNGTQCLPQSH